MNEPTEYWKSLSTEEKLELTTSSNHQLYRSWIKVFEHRNECIDALKAAMDDTPGWYDKAKLAIKGYEE